LKIAIKAISTIFASLLPILAHATDFLNVTYHTCYDGDTCKVTIAGLPEVFGDHISIRLKGIDTPEIRGKCSKEKALAKIARDMVRTRLEQAKQIDVIDAERGKYFRLVARLEADGVDLSALLIQKGLAVPYVGGTKVKDWCQ